MPLYALNTCASRYVNVERAALHKVESFVILSVLLAVCIFTEREREKKKKEEEKKKDRKWNLINIWQMFPTNGLLKISDVTRSQNSFDWRKRNTINE
jgi:hypothetical protein